MNGSQFLYVKVVLVQREAEQSSFAGGFGSTSTAIATPGRSPFTDFIGASHSVREAAQFAVQRRVSEARVDHARPTEPPANRQMIIHLNVAADDLSDETWDRLGPSGQLENEIRVQVSELFDLHLTTVHVQVTPLDQTVSMYDNGQGGGHYMGRRKPQQPASPLTGPQVVKNGNVTISYPPQPASIQIGGESTMSASGSYAPPTVITVREPAEALAKTGSEMFLLDNLVREYRTNAEELERTKTKMKEYEGEITKLKKGQDQAWNPWQLLAALSVAGVVVVTLFYLAMQNSATMNAGGPTKVALGTVNTEVSNWLNKFNEAGLLKANKTTIDGSSNISGINQASNWPQTPAANVSFGREDGMPFGDLVLLWNTPDFDALNSQLAAVSTLKTAGLLRDDPASETPAAVIGTAGLAQLPTLNGYLRDERMLSADGAYNLDLIRQRLAARGSMAQLMDQNARLRAELRKVDPLNPLLQTGSNSTSTNSSQSPIMPSPRPNPNGTTRAQPPAL